MHQVKTSKDNLALRTNRKVGACHQHCCTSIPTPRAFRYRSHLRFKYTQYGSRVRALVHPSQAKSYHRATKQVSFDNIFLERESTNATPSEWVIIDTPQE